MLKYMAKSGPRRLVANVLRDAGRLLDARQLHPLQADRPSETMADAGMILTLVNRK